MPNPSYTAFVVASAVTIGAGMLPHCLDEEYLRLLKKIRKQVPLQVFSDLLKSSSNFFDASSENRALTTDKLIEKWINDNLGNFYFRHMLGRKMLIEAVINSAINDDNVTQLVIPASGYDARGSCIASNYPRVNVFEIDRLETMNIKRQVLEKESHSNNLFLISADLEQNDWINILLEKGFDCNKKTLIILEGFTMYLTSDTLKNFLQTLDNLISFESNIFLSFNLPNAVRTSEESNLLIHSKETMKCSFLPEDAMQFCYHCGYSIESWAPTSEIHGIFGNDIKNEIEKWSKKSGAKGENYFYLNKNNRCAPQLSLEKISIMNKHFNVIKNNIEMMVQKSSELQATCITETGFSN